MNFGYIICNLDCNNSLNKQKMLITYGNRRSDRVRFTEENEKDINFWTSCFGNTIIGFT